MLKETKSELDVEERRRERQTYARARGHDADIAWRNIKRAEISSHRGESE